jgi:hypothetical protein
VRFTENGTAADALGNNCTNWASLRALENAL